MYESNMAGARSIDQGDSEFSFDKAVRGFHVDCSVWLPHFEQPLRVEREHGIAEARSPCLSESTATLELMMIKL